MQVPVRSPSSDASGPSPDRTGEWFVPRFGPRAFRVAVGLLFLPYTGMVLAFTVMGAMLAPTVHWDRVVALLAIYALALGVAAHALDALGSRASKPWGEALSRRALLAVAIAALVLAYAIGIWYMQLYAPWLWPIAIAEGLFLLAYNLEWFGGRFHTDAWFALSWGALPALAGYVLQTNAVSVAALVLAAATAALSLVEIKASRPYKALRAAGVILSADTTRMARALELVLKSVSIGVMLAAVAWALARAGW